MGYTLPECTIEFQLVHVSPPMSTLIITCTALHCTALHCTALHFIALHCCIADEVGLCALHCTEWSDKKSLVNPKVPTCKGAKIYNLSINLPNTAKYIPASDPEGHWATSSARWPESYRATSSARWPKATARREGHEVLQACCPVCCFVCQSAVLLACRL